MTRYLILPLELLALLLGVLAMPFIAMLLLMTAPAKPRGFRYAYQAHPFDDANYFWIDADTQEAADEAAKQKFGELFRNRQTIMTEFWAA